MAVLSFIAIEVEKSKKVTIYVRIKNLFYSVEVFLLLFIIKN